MTTELSCGQIRELTQRAQSASPVEDPAAFDEQCVTTPEDVEALTAAGLLDGAGLSDAGRRAVDPFRVDNAIIMAAGLSTRFVPLSYEMPKGLLQVRGEVLVERQIRQLQEAGISDITVVVGYMEERFEYLAEAFGVDIVENPDYRTRNNNSSLWQVRDRLANTYVCSSDNYFAANPFHAFEPHAYYAAEYVQGPTPEWCLELADDDRITGVHVGGADSWVMMGHVHFDREFSTRFVEILESVYDEPETADKLWESLYIDHIDTLTLRARRYAPGVISEFDSLDDLTAFDPSFLDHVDSPILDNITTTLGCARREIHDCFPLAEGLTNLSFHFATDTGEYVYRHPGVGTENMIDRAVETEALKLARRLDLDDTFIHEDPVRGWKLSHFIPDARPLDATSAEEVQRAMELCRRLHDAGATLERTFDFFRESLRYEEILLAHGPVTTPGYAELREKIVEVKEFTGSDGFPVCLNHNDFFPLNLLIDAQGGLTLIDWEYAGMSDMLNDVATFTVCCSLTADQADAALGYYLGRTPEPDERRHFWAYVCLAGWCWYVWALAKEAEGDDVGEWREIYHRYATDHVDGVLAWYRDSRRLEGTGSDILENQGA